jgi:hypothetical protein
MHARVPAVNLCDSWPGTRTSSLSSLERTMNCGTRRNDRQIPLFLQLIFVTSGADGCGGQNARLPAHVRQRCSLSVIL